MLKKRLNLNFSQKTASLQLIQLIFADKFQHTNEINILLESQISLAKRARPKLFQENKILNWSFLLSWLNCNLDFITLPLFRLILLRFHLNRLFLKRFHLKGLNFSKQQFGFRYTILAFTALLTFGVIFLFNELRNLWVMIFLMVITALRFCFTVWIRRNI